MNKYKGLWKWMIVPMVIMQLGIFMDYWGDLRENAFSVHVHYWTGTAWYLFLIIQPYFVTHGQIERHRTVGIIGMFLAGGVCLTAVSMLHRDIASADKSMAQPERFGPFEPWFFFGVAAVEIVMMVAFGFAVIMSIIHRKEIENHSWWLISTVFLIMMPALARGAQFVYIWMNFQQMPNVDIMIPGYISQFIILGLIVAAAWKFGTLRHPATYLAVAVNASVLFLEPIGRSATVESILRAIIKS
ncbi:MAG: hypothetical protein PSX80_14760 [bacterium]|nr:hypothetical protein [bacterium]